MASEQTVGAGAAPASSRVVRGAGAVESRPFYADPLRLAGWGVALVALVAYWWLFGRSPAPPPGAPIARLTGVEGRVRVRPNEREEWLEARLSLLLHVGDTVQTDLRSGAQISFDSGSVVQDATREHRVRGRYGRVLDDGMACRLRARELRGRRHRAGDRQPLGTDPRGGERRRAARRQRAGHGLQDLPRAGGAAHGARAEGHALGEPGGPGRRGRPRGRARSRCHRPRRCSRPRRARPCRTPPRRRRSPRCAGRQPPVPRPIVWRWTST